MFAHATGSGRNGVALITALDVRKKGVDKRRAVEGYREKKAAAAGMHRRGVPIPEIAAQLQTDASRVQRWLERTSSAKDKDGIARQDSSRDKA